MTPAILISDSGRISGIVNGKPLTVENSHPNYGKILDAIREGSWDVLVSLVDVAQSVRNFISGGVELRDGQVFYRGEALHNSITDRILGLMGDNLPFQPMLNFLGNLMENPSKRAVDELYGFLEAGELPLTEDGHFLAFKKIRADWRDIHSGTFDNSVGAVCEMPRNRVDEDKDRTCSAGLHFCSKDYLPHFGGEVGSGYRIVIVKINPRDVVSIPADYHDTKGRCCRYEVVAELEGDVSQYVGKKVIGEFDPNDEGYFDEYGFDEYGYDAEGYDEDGYDEDGYDEDGYDEEGYDRDGYDEEGYDRDGLDQNGIELGHYESQGNVAYKPSGQKYHNKRDGKGRFTR